MIKITVLDGQTLNPGDLSWEGLEKLSLVTVYLNSSSNEIVERAKSSDILIVNKSILDQSILEQLPRLKYICVSATGYNNVDLEYCTKRNIPVSNVSGYGTSAVAQHVFALLFALTNQVEKYSNEVHHGEWSKQINFSYWNHSIVELSGQTMGIYGFGKIGKAVAQIAIAFGMKVIAHHKHPERDKMEGVEFVSLEKLFSNSDVLTLHAPLTPKNKGIISNKNLSKMKSNAYLINTGRGDLVDETDLKEALNNNIIAGVGLDVLSQEPPPPDHILFGVKNCIITPHQAWGSLAARQRLLDETVKNVEGYFTGKLRNLVS